VLFLKVFFLSSTFLWVWSEALKSSRSRIHYCEPTVFRGQLLLRPSVLSVLLLLYTPTLLLSLNSGKRVGRRQRTRLGFNMCFGGVLR
jgi:hypothetical protein